MQKLNFFWLLILSALILQSCSDERKPVRSVFLWQNDYYLGEDDMSRLDSLSVSHVYLKYADIQWNMFTNSAEPVYDDSRYGFTHSNVTPVIFITNEVLEFTPSDKIAALAKKISRLYEAIHLENAENFVNDY